MPEQSRATLRQILQATAGAITDRVLPGRGAAQASGPTVYVGSWDDNLYAVDAGTGEQEWAFDTGGGVRSSPTVVDGIVYVGSWDGNLCAVDAGTGEQEWAFDTGGRVQSSPTVVDGIVYVGSKDSTLYAVDAGTGEQEWVFDTDFQVRSSPTVVDGIVYVGSRDSTLYAVDAGTGEQEWAFDTGDSVWSSPTMVDGIVYIGSRDSTLYAVDAGTGEQEWVFDTGGGVRSSPTVVDGIVYIGSRDSTLYAVDAGTGEQEWVFDTGGGVRSSPTVVDGTVYVGSRDSTLYAVDAGTGEQEWVFDTGGGVRSSPTVVDGTVYVGSRDSTLYAVDAGTGEQEWAFETGSIVSSSPTVVDHPEGGDSIGSRATLGTLGHHSEWRYAGQDTLAEFDVRTSDNKEQSSGRTGRPSSRPSVRAETKTANRNVATTDDSATTSGVTAGTDREDESTDLTSISRVNEDRANALREAGYPTVDSVRAASKENLSNVEGIEMALAARIKADVGDTTPDETIPEKRDQIEELRSEFEQKSREEHSKHITKAEEAISRGIEQREADNPAGAVDAFTEAQEHYDKALKLAEAYELPGLWETEQRHSMVTEYLEVAREELEERRHATRNELEQALEAAESSVSRAEQYDEVNDHVSARESLSRAIDHLDEATQLLNVEGVTDQQQSRYDDLVDRAETVQKNLPDEEDSGRYRNQDLVESLQRLATKLGESPRPEFVNEYGEYPADAYLDAFGSWPEALAAANLDSIDESARDRRSYSRVDILDELVRLSNELGHPPSRTEMNRKGNISSTTVENRFRDWDTALEIAGVMEGNSSDSETGEPSVSDSGSEDDAGQSKATQATEEKTQQSESNHIEDPGEITQKIMEDLEDEL